MSRETLEGESEVIVPADVRGLSSWSAAGGSLTAGLVLTEECSIVDQKHNSNFHAV